MKLINLDLSFTIPMNYKSSLQTVIPDNYEASLLINSFIEMRCWFHVKVSFRVKFIDKIR